MSLSAALQELGLTEPQAVHLATFSPIIYRDTTLVTVANSAAEETLVSLTLPANSISKNSGIRFTAHGWFFNNTVGTVNCRWRIKLGSTTVLQTESHGYAQDASAKRSTIIKGMIYGDGASGSQVAFGNFGIAQLSDGAGQMDDEQQFELGHHETVGETETGELTFTITADMNTADANAQVAHQGLFIEKFYDGIET